MALHPMYSEDINQKSNAKLYNILFAAAKYFPRLVLVTVLIHQAEGSYLQCVCKQNFATFLGTREGNYNTTAVVKSILQLFWGKGRNI